MGRYVGVDIGAETIKLVELSGDHDDLQWNRHAIFEHHKQPGPALLRALADWAWSEVDGAAASGRLARVAALPRIPTKQAQAAGFRFCHDDPAAIVTIGAHGFSVLELRASGSEVFRENGRCSQGTGTFLRQLVERFDLSVEEASDLCVGVDDPAPLSGRCPVILKTDMTHLANRGESQARILAGLYDAVCENVQGLINPRSCPSTVLLAGGVARSVRIREHFERFLAGHGIGLLDSSAGLCLEALGCAVLAAEQQNAVPSPEALLVAPEVQRLENVPALAAFLPQVTRMPAIDLGQQEEARPAGGGLILGFDIGSTGSKLAALEITGNDGVRLRWQEYTSTNGDPVAAAQRLMGCFASGPVSDCKVLACGVTGSGREIVGSLLATCYGPEAIFVINEIAAHAAGALHFDSRVDTIFEIGGQDAKYIRLESGRVIDAAMNEACSAGTGSFIEEQGRRFEGISDVVDLGQKAVRASSGVSLGQHCSVFMAEIIDEAVASGVEQDAILAGIYDSIVQNYLNRVKGCRSVGNVIFCQGMPFAADALAAAVARQTDCEVIVPPSPGTVGALGIALLADKELSVSTSQGLAPERFLAAEVVAKDEFVCGSTKGCGGSGNRCRIDRLTTLVAQTRQRFTWGGNCSLYDCGTAKAKLPDLAPDPFRERAQLLEDLCGQLESRGRPRVVMTDEFQLTGLIPFFATFIHELGFDVEIKRNAGREEFSRGIEEANIPFCAPIALYHGLAAAMVETGAEYAFLPMVRSLPRLAKERHAAVCPMVQASPELIRANLGLAPDAPCLGSARLEAGRTSRGRAAEEPRGGSAADKPRGGSAADKPRVGSAADKPRGGSGNCQVVAPRIDFGAANFDSPELVASCRRLAAELGVKSGYRAALARARQAQDRYDEACVAIGHRALKFCAEQDLNPIVVLGRSYTLHNDVLNSNVPAILRSQGAMAIPVDCYPVDPEVPVFDSMYWAFAQQSLRAAHQVRRSPGVYSLWCSNYSCGPDSFATQFYGYIMEGKPFALIETDGHSGDAGTRTRVEAFLYCVAEDMRRPDSALLNHFQRAQRSDGLLAVRERCQRVLVPRMGPDAEVLAAGMRGSGLQAECLPMPDREALRLGRRYTSGKECLPMCITLGSLLQRIEAGPDKEPLAFFMPCTCGPCRFGVYHVLHRIVLEKLGHEQVRIWSPVDSDYFAGCPAGTEVRVYAGFLAMATLQEICGEVAPVETRPGATKEIRERYSAELVALIEQQLPASELTKIRALGQVVGGGLFGCADLLARAVAELVPLKSDKVVPTVQLVGEIYVRLDPFANDFIVNKLAARGIRVRLPSSVEWIEYADWTALKSGEQSGLAYRLTWLTKQRMAQRLHAIAAPVLGRRRRPKIARLVKAAAPYVREDLHGEAVLTVGSPALHWRDGEIDGVVVVGPLECMPAKIAEAQLFHLAEREGLPSLTLPLNGDPIDPELLDNFVYELGSGSARCA